jgi:hypothetical protein
MTPQGMEKKHAHANHDYRTVMLLLAGSLIWKAEAATMSGVGSLAPRTKSYTPVENVYYYRRGYYGWRRPY